MWQILNKTIGRHNDKTAFPNKFIINNEQVTDEQQIVEGFNNYLSEMGFQNWPESLFISTFKVRVKMLS